MALRKALRNGSWACLSSTEKALYRCALWIAKRRGCIINNALVAQVLGILQSFFEGIRTRIAAAGRKRARTMLESYARHGGVFSWAPRVKEWLLDANYIFFLGVSLQ